MKYSRQLVFCIILSTVGPGLAKDDPSPEPSAPASPAAQGRVLHRMDALGINRDLIDHLLADEAVPLVAPRGRLSGEQRRSRLLDWRAVIDRRQTISQLEAEGRQLESKRDQAADAPGRAQPSDLAPLKAALERNTRALATATLDIEAAEQSLQALRASEGAKPPSPPSGAPHQKQVQDFLANPVALAAARLRSLQREAEVRKQLQAVQTALVERLKPLKPGTAEVAPSVSPSSVSSWTQQLKETAQEVAREQTQAQATIRAAEQDAKAAERVQHEASEQGASAASGADKELAAQRLRLAERTQAAAEALKTLGQLKADAGTARLEMMETAAERYRWLLQLATAFPSVTEVAGVLRALRPKIKALTGREQSYAARLAQVKDDLVSLDAERTTLEQAAKSKGKSGAALLHETKVLGSHRRTLDDQAVTLTHILESLRANIDSSSKLQEELERILGEEGLLVRRKREFSLTPLRGFLTDMVEILSAPSRGLRPVAGFFSGCWSALMDDQAGSVLAPMLGCIVFAFSVPIFGARPLRHWARRAAKDYGPATAATLSVVASGVLWIPLFLPVALGATLIPSQTRGFQIILLCLCPWFMSHLTLRLARKWFLVPRVPPESAPDSKLARSSMDLFLGPVPTGDLHALEGETCARVQRTLIPIAVLTSTLLPIYLVMGATLYRPDLGNQIWLVFELLVAWLLYKTLRLLSRLVQIRRSAGVAHRWAVRMIGSLQAMTFVCVPAVPLVEVFGFASLARFLVGRSALTVLVAHVALLTFEAVMEMWRDPNQRQETQDTEEAEDAPAGVESLSELVASFLSLVLMVGTIFTLFWIWGGTTAALQALAAGSRWSVSMMGIELSVRGLIGAAFALWFARWMSQLMEYLLQFRFFPRTEFDAGMRYAISQTVWYSIIASGLIWALYEIGVGMEGVKWFAGFAGIGIGLGMQTILSNFISGLIVLYERPVRVGDVVDVKGVFGIIKRISVRSTLVRQSSNVDVFVPNSALLAENVVNWSLRAQRVRLEVPLALKSDVDPLVVKEIMLAVAADEPTVLKRPAPVVLCERANESGLGLVLLVWVKSAIRTREIRSNLLFATLAQLQQRGIPSVEKAEKE